MLSDIIRQQCEGLELDYLEQPGKEGRSLRELSPLAPITVPREQVL